MTQSIDWWAIAPPLSLVTAAILALLGDAFAPRARHVLPTLVSVWGVGTGLLYLGTLDHPRATFCRSSDLRSPTDCSWVVDHVTTVWWFIILVATALIVLLLQPAVARGELPAGEVHFLLLASATGALAVAAAGDLVTLLVAIETVSLPAFALVGLRSGDRAGAEAALKFFIASVVATAFTLLGISMVYGATGSVGAGAISVALSTDTAVTPVVGVGMALTVVALTFKIAAVPFQVWVPDTYVGAPVPVAAYLSVVSKAAGLAGLTIVLVRFFSWSVDTWSPIIAVVAALTMTVGNLAALRQQHAVRLLAWSSVAQAGYLLVPLAAGGRAIDVGRLQSYALMYAVVNICAFAVVWAGARWGAVTVSDYAGLMRRSPWIGSALAFALLCLAGLPPGVIGLVAKVVIFQSAVDNDLVWLAAVMAVNVAIGLVYYLRFIVKLFEVAEPDSPTRLADSDELDLPRTVDFVIGCTVAAAVVLSFAPGLLFGPIL